MNDRIQVIARIRPLTRTEIERNDEVITATSDSTIYLEPVTSSGISYKSYRLDGVLDSSDSQTKVFESVEPLLHCLLEGYNCSLFTYGQTGILHLALP
jgi:kinesin family member 11